MNRREKQQADRLAQHMKQRKLRGKFFDTYKGVVMEVRDATGREIKKGHLVQVPVNAFPDVVANMEVVDILPGTVLDTPGVPKRPPMIVLSMHLMIPINPNNHSVPYCYVVGERRRVQQAGEPAQTEVKLDTETPPEGIVLPDGEDKPN